MGQRWNLNSTEYRRNFDEYVNGQLLAGKRVTVEFVDEHRTLDQNALINAMYGQISKSKEDETVQEIRRYCKLHHGVPILRRDSEKFQSLYDKVIKPHDYATKLQMMDYLPVTSEMGKKQATEYIDTVVREYANQGVFIQMPGDEQ